MNEQRNEWRYQTVLIFYFWSFRPEPVPVCFLKVENESSLAFTEEINKGNGFKLQMRELSRGGRISWQFW